MELIAFSFEDTAAGSAQPLAGKAEAAQKEPAAAAAARDFLRGDQQSASPCLSSYLGWGCPRPFPSPVPACHPRVHLVTSCRCRDRTVEAKGVGDQALSPLLFFWGFTSSLGSEPSFWQLAPPGWRFRLGDGSSDIQPVCSCGC